MRDRRDALDADVVVGDQRDVRVAELQLAGEQRLGVLGHVDDLPAGGREPRRLRARARTAAPRSPRRCRARAAGCPARVPARRSPLAHRGAVRIGEGDVRRDRARRRTCSRGRACGRRAGRRSRSRRASRSAAASRTRSGPSTRRHAELLHRPHVRPVGDAVRRELVLQAVPRDERDAAAADVADHRRRAGLAVRRVDRPRSRVAPGTSRTRAAEHADLRRRHVRFVFLRIRRSRLRTTSPRTRTGCSSSM